MEASAFGGLSNGFKKLVVLFQVFFVPVETVLHIDLPLDLAFGLDVDLVVQVGHQLFLVPVEVTPFAAGFFELPNHPSDADALVVNRNAQHNAQTINKRRFISYLPRH